MENDFYKKQQAALESMREMNLRAKPAANAEAKNNSTKKANPSAQNGINIPFLEGIFKDSDSTLILGLLLLLMSEKGDKMLLFALVYILL